MDRAYTNLLAQLHTTSPSLPLATIQSALAHYLANLAPLPTPLAATAVSSALYLAQPFTNEKLHSLLTAFRHAIHLKYRGIKEDIKTRPRIENLFSKSLNGALSSWVTDVVKGTQGGHHILRLSSLSGLLLGIHDLELESGTLSNRDQIQLGSARSALEDELIIATAEVMDAHSPRPTPESSGGWESEFQPSDRDVLTMALLVASHSLPLVSPTKLQILPLHSLIHLVVVTISSTLHSGKFLRELATSIVRQDEHLVHIPPNAPVAQTLRSITASPVLGSAASLTRLGAHSLRLLLGSRSTSRVTKGLSASMETLDILRDMAMQIEEDWNKGHLVDVLEHDIAPATRPITQAIWTTLKTLLFSVVMISEAILSSVVYIKPASSPYNQASTTSSELALQVLHIFSHFSFIISQFGGVTSTSPGFEQLKKTFYLALDILSQVDSASYGGQSRNSLPEDYVRDQSLFLQSPSFTNAPKSIKNSKKAIVLASIEQLVPALSEDCIREHVLDICLPHLSEVSHRETFESAHSVILAVFASHAQQRQRQSVVVSDRVDLLSAYSENNDFIKKMVPFYARCLIENSAEGKLITTQLRMAYSALVRCASASGLNVDTVPVEASTLAWYCIQLLVDAIQFKENIEVDQERLNRLLLMLISSIPSLPLVLMLQALEEIKSIITSLPPPSPSSSNMDDLTEKKAIEPNELVKALFDELIERVGYREKSAVMQWWIIMARSKLQPYHKASSWHDDSRYYRHQRLP
ncbi:hypothetical protein Agabi119p4_7136 [Agaricus bisporus var. burnettii]|uniref:Peroxisomal membrane protein PEX17 n=1 Tax=Agaricus bisporus var. burnettii TaxID=192524 RepID=A0A8H7C7K3_AGABI|nr:hypothetical protein Agabi119p4_7136 [Agaricus bisporus var. burnettii]